MVELTKKEVSNVSGGFFGFAVTFALKLRPDGAWMYNGGSHRTSNKL